MRRLLAVCATVVACAIAAAGAAPLQPKLAVILVVDQMRADYVDRFSGEWTGGLKQLVTEGAVFTRAAYPYLTTVTCAGHATIGTGAFPHRHGMFQNVWWDRNRGRSMRCTEDPAAKPIPYGKQGGDEDSARNLMVPTFADVMRTERHAHVVSLSIKARSAIMLAGHGGDAVSWVTESLDHWQTSTAFAAAPVPEVAAFVVKNPIDADYGRVWERFLPLAKYQSPDDDDTEAPPKGWTRTFPHALRGSAGDTKPGPDFYQQWERSPFADDYLGRMAAVLVDSFQLGRHGGTDVLTVSFSTPDVVGHAFGPRSQEIEDIYARLDRTIAQLLAALDAAVGRDGYLLALSSDHGVTEIPEQLERAGRDGGRFDTRTLTSMINERLRVILGAGSYVARISANDIYLMPGIYAKLAERRGALDALKQMLGAQPGVARVFTADELLAGAGSADSLLRAAALSYVPGRSGDLVLAPKAGWMFSASGTTHGSANTADQAVPIVFFGRGVRPGHYDTPATPADIAPTLAWICGVALPQAEGRPLTDAFAQN